MPEQPCVPMSRKKFRRGRKDAGKFNWQNHWFYRASDVLNFRLKISVGAVRLANRGFSRLKRMSVSRKKPETETMRKLAQ
ncbi:MAG TPA: hypothetical protein VFE46_11370 [Pirellulales bacterium]|nr:hypothetical protein [Pirellulales bacterium]